MLKRLRQMLCRHMDNAIEFELSPLAQWVWTCARCGKVRVL